VELVRHRQTKETEQIGFTYGTPHQSSTLHIQFRLYATDMQRRPLRSTADERAQIPLDL